MLANAMQAAQGKSPEQLSQFIQNTINTTGGGSMNNLMGMIK